MTEKECRVYGNQHGSWIEFSGALADRIAHAAALLGITPEELVNQALDERLSGE